MRKKEKGKGIGFGTDIHVLSTTFDHYVFDDCFEKRVFLVGKLIFDKCILMRDN
jgi:hypothetical protein